MGIGGWDIIILTLIPRLKDYNGGYSYEAVVEFIKQKYLSLNSNRNRLIVTYVTNATDTGTMKVVFDSVKAILLEQIMKEGGVI